MGIAEDAIDVMKGGKKKSARTAVEYAEPSGPDSGPVAAEPKKVLAGDGPWLDEYGREVIDPRPMAPPVGWFKQPSMIDHIRSMVRQELSRTAQDQGFESFEEADDFDVEDEHFDPTTPYEEVFEPSDAERFSQALERHKEPASKPVPPQPAKTPAVSEPAEAKGEGE